MSDPSDQSSAQAEAETPSSSAADVGSDAIAGGASWAEAPGLVARGFCMGTADVVPGVSGGTMALILGIYVRLVAAIRSIDATALKHGLSGRIAAARDHVAWRFLGAMACGQFLGVVLFTKVLPLPRYLQTHPELVYGLFFGLVVGSVIALGRDVLTTLSARGSLGAAIAASLAGLGLGLVVVTAVPAQTPETAPFVFLCGCVSISAMILPGISGSFVLLLLRKYAYVLGAVGEVIKPTGSAGRLDPLLSVVLPFAAGCVVGLLLFTRVLSWLLRTAERATFAFMTGLLAGSLYALWPWAERTYETVRGKPRLLSSTPQWPADLASAAPSVILALVGGVAVLSLERMARARVGAKA